MGKITKSGRALNKNEKILLTALFLVSILFIYYTIFLGPSLKKLTPLKEEVQKLKSQLKDTGNLSSNIKSKEEELAKLKVQYDDATKAMPKGDRYPELSKELGDKARKQGLTISNLAFSKPEIYNENGENVESTESEGSQINSDGLLQYYVTLSVEGDFNKAVEFIKSLEADKRIMKVNEITANNDKIDINLNYIVAGSQEVQEYEFNNGSYGKDNLFN